MGIRPCPIPITNREPKPRTGDMVWLSGSQVYRFRQCNPFTGNHLCADAVAAPWLRSVAEPRSSSWVSASVCILLSVPLPESHSSFASHR